MATSMSRSPHRRRNRSRDDQLRLIDAYWRAANYLSVGQIYLLDNPLLRTPLEPKHVKPRLLGHWGTTPGINFVYAHMNRAIRNWDLDAILIVGPGHGGPGAVANAYLEGTYSETYPHVGRDSTAARPLPPVLVSRRHSVARGAWRHRGRSTKAASSATRSRTPTAPRSTTRTCSSLRRRRRRGRDRPARDVVALEQVPRTRRDGAVLPILHLNGYKIANPTVLARIGDDELTSLLEGYGHRVYWVDGHEPAAMHRRMAAVLDEVVEEIGRIQRAARVDGSTDRPRWPVIVLRTPKGWTGPKTVDGLPTEGTWRSHQVPLAEVRTNPEHLAELEAWLRSYRADELFDANGVLVSELAALPPKSYRRMSANPHANGGLLLEDLKLPDFRKYAVEVARPGATSTEPTRVLGSFLRDVVRANPHTFRIFGPDETASNRLSAVFEATERAWNAETLPTDEHLARHGEVVEMLSEHQCQGWLEGYLLTGRHGLFNCYEAFIHIVDSMFNQHAKWLKTTRDDPWRRPIASLNYLLSSHVWRQDHNGFTHQDPGFIDHVVNKKGGGHPRLPAARREHAALGRRSLSALTSLRERDRRRKQPALDYLSMDDAILHCTRGIGIWSWASNDRRRPRCRARLLRRHPDARDARCGRRVASRAAVAESPRRQRRRPDAAAPAIRTSARTFRHGVRRALHRRQAGRVRVPRLSVADPPAHLPPHEPQQHPCPRLQGGGHDDDAVRHGDAQRPRPLPPRRST
jgi:xylulose-5-phosphate/fructose-6-phosphate phosphoketolase